MIEIPDHPANLDISVNSRGLSCKLNNTHYGEPNDHNKIENDRDHVVNPSKAFAPEVWFNTVIGVNHEKVFKKIADVEPFIQKDEDHLNDGKPYKKIVAILIKKINEFVHRVADGEYRCYKSNILILYTSNFS